MSTRIIALCLALLSPGLASALPANSIERFYFSDRTMTEMVGSETIMTCWGRPRNSTLEGRRTRFFASVAESCSPSARAMSGRVRCTVDGMLTECPEDICSSPLFHCR